MNRYLLASLIFLSIAKPAASGLYDCKEAWGVVKYTACGALCAVTGETCTAIQQLNQNCQFAPFSDCVEWDVAAGGVTLERVWVIECVQRAGYCSCDGTVISFDENSVPGNECERP